MTEYLVLTKGEASLARSGPLAMTRAVRGGALVSQHLGQLDCGEDKRRAYRQVWW